MIYLVFKYILIITQISWCQEDDLFFDGLGIFKDENECPLPPELGGSGKSTLIQECENLDLFKIPIPDFFRQQLGVHSSICCPKQDTNSDEMYLELKEENEIICAQGYSCTSLARCDIMERRSLDPISVYSQVALCGFDEESTQLMFCCPAENILAKPKPSQKPRFLKDNKPYNCEDLTGECRKWSSNGACQVNVTYVTSKNNGIFESVSSQDMIQFTTKTCLKSCNRCGNKGCVDEHDFCPKWAREGNCAFAPFFMAQMCRESCGTCGFLSTLSNETQFYDGRSYSHISDQDFDCGRYKTWDFLKMKGLNVITGEEDRRKRREVTGDDQKETDSLEDLIRALSVDADNVDEVSFANINRRGEFSCTATMISDKWMLTAAHCSGELVKSGVISSQIIRTYVPELTEQIEVIRRYIHPEYKYPELHSDVALLELGRRVEFKLEEFGDTPTCLDKGLDLPGKVATAQGYGITGDSKEGGTLLEINVTLIETQDCIELLDVYLNNNTNKKKKELFCSTFPDGITDQQVCAVGIFNKEKNVTTATCKGDSGGPLYLEDSEGFRNLIGIVSGSLSCRAEAPEWYTSIKFYRSWIECIMDKSTILNFNKAKIEEECRSVATTSIDKKWRNFCKE